MKNGVRVRIPLMLYDAYRVVLPTFQMVADSVRPLVKDRIHENGVYPDVKLTPQEESELSVEVDTLSEYLSEDRKSINIDAVKRAFGGNPMEAKVDADTVRIIDLPSNVPPQALGWRNPVLSRTGG